MKVSRNSMGTMHVLLFYFSPFFKKIVWSKATCICSKLIRVVGLNGLRFRKWAMPIEHLPVFFFLILVNNLFNPNILNMTLI